MFSFRPFHDSLIISTYEINTFYISLQPWRGVFGSNLFSKLDKMCVNHRKKCLKTPDGNNGIIKIQNRIRQATQVREYRRGIKKRTIQRK